ncbi:MAG: response regulator [bacterium]|nr:response regulator [bacterium]
MTTIRHKVLIVEDEAQLRHALRDRLMREGFNVLEANNGQEGLTAALVEHPDMILLDIIMPIMDGITMLTKLRENAWGKNARVIILTNLSDNEKVAEAMENGSFDYLVKSDWKLEEIIEMIHERLAGE